MDAAKPASATRVEVTGLVPPGDAHVLGSAFGGEIMRRADLAASLAARHCRLPVVTASIDPLSFLAPVRIGQQRHLHRRR